MIIPRTIYALRHNPTGRIYVGSSKNVKLRAMSHLYNLRSSKHPNLAMQEDFDRYGEDYTCYVLERIETYAHRNHEYLWMEALHTRDPEHGYNFKDQKAEFDLENRKTIELEGRKTNL